MSADGQNGQHSSQPLPRWLAVLATCSAILVALTYVEEHATSLLNGFPKLREAANNAVSGPKVEVRALRPVAGNVEDGQTSDSKQAYWKYQLICIKPETSGATLVPGSAKFVVSRRTSENRSLFKVVQDDTSAYCVQLSAGTGAKEVLEAISGNLIGQEQYRPPA